LDPKIGITIGYGLDIIGFATIFFSGGFDSIYKGSLGAIEALENEIKIMKGAREQVGKLWVTTVTTGYGGAPSVGTGLPDYSFLHRIDEDIKSKETNLDTLRDSHRAKFSKYILKNGKAPLVGFVVVVTGAIFQWWFSSFGAI
jgi:hypothetical protein